MYSLLFYYVPQPHSLHAEHRSCVAYFLPFRFRLNEYWVHRSAVCQTNCFFPPPSDIHWFAFWCYGCCFHRKCFRKYLLKKREVTIKKPVRFDRFYYHLCTVQCSVFGVTGNGFLCSAYRQSVRVHLSIRQTFFVLFCVDIIIFFPKTKILRISDFIIFPLFARKQFQEFCVTTNKSIRITEQMPAAGRRHFSRHFYGIISYHLTGANHQFSITPIEHRTISFQFRSRIYSCSKWIISGIQTILLSFVMSHGTWRTDANHPKKQKKKKQCGKETKKKNLQRSLYASQRDKHECWIFQFISLR